MEKKILELCDKLLNSQGFRTVDVECLVGPRSSVQVFIEPLQISQSNEGPLTDSRARTSLEDCAKVSEVLGPALEVEDLISGRYDLEVSSPGLDRRLRLKTDFEAQTGKEVRLRLTRKILGLGDRPKGKIDSIDNGNLSLIVDGKSFSVPLNQIKRANLIWSESEGKGK